MNAAEATGTMTVTGAGPAPAADAAPQVWLHHAREVTDPVLREAVDSLHPRARAVAGYHLGWWDAHGRPVTDGWGKAVRPALALLSARALGAPCGTGAHCAAAVQLAHDSSLLHDDIIDRDDLRRHRPAAWRVFGVADALLAGDALLALAVSLAHRDAPAAPPAPPAPATSYASQAPATSHASHASHASYASHASHASALNDAVQQFIGGQFEDMGFEERTEVSLTECTTMAARKTGALMGAACRTGALAGGAGEGPAAELDAFGRSLGLAYQHVDDLLGIWGDPRATGKPAGADLHARKKSLPVVAALESDTPEAAELAELYARDPASDDAGLLRHAASLVERAGGRQRAGGLARRYLTEALDHLDATGLPAADTRPLRALAAWLALRDH